MNNNIAEVGKQEIANEQQTCLGETQEVINSEKAGVLNNGSNTGKFKDVKDLLNAYNSLQAEFTRRCQKVKELERETENLKAQQLQKDCEFNTEEDFLKPILGDVSSETLGELKSIADGSNDQSKLRLVNAYVKNLQNQLANAKENTNNNNPLTISNELKDSVIKQYLSDLIKSKTGVTFITGNGQGVVAPPLKPKSLAEAGLIARHILDN